MLLLYGQLLKFRYLALYQTFIHLGRAGLDFVISSFLAEAIHSRKASRYLSAASVASRASFTRLVLKSRSSDTRGQCCWATCNINTRSSVATNYNIVCCGLNSPKSMNLLKEPGSETVRKKGYCCGWLEWRYLKKSWIAEHQFGSWFRKCQSGSN